jgi:hypothetical protein
VVVAAEVVDVAPKFASGPSTMTVLVEVEVRPPLSVAMYSIVWVPGWDVLISIAPIIVVALPSTIARMPRLRSCCGPVMVAPRSV